MGSSRGAARSASHCSRNDDDMAPRGPPGRSSHAAHDVAERGAAARQRSSIARATRARAAGIFAGRKFGLMR